jgi:hypothetical protein
MRSQDRLPWLLLPGILLTLGGVTLLAPRRAAQAAPPTVQAAPKAPTPALDDDGDGDELLEHWGDPKYAREERLQLAGMAGGFVLLGGLACRKRVRGRTRVATRAIEDVYEQRKAA